MLWNENKKLLNPLRTRKVQPSFEEIRNLVLNNKRRSFFLITSRSWMYLALCILLFITPSILLFPQFFGLERIEKTSGYEAKLPDQVQIAPNENPASLENHSQIHSQTFSMKAEKSLVLELPQAFDNSDKKIVVPGKPQNNKPEDNAVTDKKVAKEEIKDNSDKKIDQPQKLNDKNSAESAISPIQQSLSESMINHSDTKFYTFISGGFPTSQSTIPFSNRLSYSVGIGYSINSASSFLLELRRNVFINRYSVNKTISHDTSIRVGVGYDTSYQQKTINITTSSLTESANSFFTLGAGFRYSFLQDSKLIPYGEFHIGGNTSGALTSEIIGLQYSFNPFGIEIGMRSDQLFTSGSSPQNVFNANMGISYWW